MFPDNVVSNMQGYRFLKFYARLNEMHIWNFNNVLDTQIQKTICLQKYRYLTNIQ